MKYVIFAALFIQFTLSAFSQRPTIEVWDKRFGGTNYDVIYAVQETYDKGYILGGRSNSGISGDKTQDDWDTSYISEDYWLVKVDSVGNKEWDRRFGGTAPDVLFTLQQTSDSGYVAGGISYSDSSGDKTQPGWGSRDFWIVKVDKYGNKRWDKRFGGIYDDIMTFVRQTADGGFILVGSSDSPVSGDKTQGVRGGNSDGWAVKIDALGNKQWDKRFGGDKDDEFLGAVQTPDGGYLLAGTTSSDSGFDVSQPDRGNYDYWIVKTDSSGNKEWDRRYGGNNADELGAIVHASDGGFILGGFSVSDSSGDKTTNSFSYWMVKIDTLGNKQWDYGYNQANTFYSLTNTLDGGYLLTGTSTADSIGDKTENNLGDSQTWIVKTDSFGRKQWDKTIKTYESNIGYGIQTSDGCYLIAGATPAGIGGYKTQPNWDYHDSTDDYWISKYCFTGRPEGIEDLTSSLQLNIYPNPFTSELDISIAQPNLKQADISICNILGQTVYTQHETNLSPAYTKMLDLSNLPNGVYLIEIVVGSEVTVREVVKR